MGIKIVDKKITKEELKELAKEFYETLIKGVVDIEKEIIALGGEYHMDANIVLIDKGSKQKDIWGFNIHLDKPKDSGQWIEYTALINIRPAQENSSMEINDPEIKEKIRRILSRLIE